MDCSAGLASACLKGRPGGLGSGMGRQEPKPFMSARVVLVDWTELRRAAAEGSEQRTVPIMARLMPGASLRTEEEYYGRRRGHER